MNADGDTAADAVFDTGGTKPSEPRHVQKKKREANQFVAAATAASAALLSGQNMSDVNGATAIKGTVARGGAGVDLQGEEPLPLGSRPEKDSSNAKVLGSSSGSAGSRRPRATRKVAPRGAAKSQKTGDMRRETRVAARPVPRSALASLASSASRSLPPSSSSAAVKPQALPPVPRAVAKDQDPSASAVVSSLGHEPGTLMSREDNVVGNSTTFAVESSKAEVRLTMAHTAGCSERHEKEHVRLIPPSFPAL